ncbi:hypothetical protein GCM10010207_85900 [Streptomyces atratus]|nr:hypothetical protein GCM10010207_85900 [Streptomyces atratus]
MVAAVPWELVQAAVSMTAASVNTTGTQVNLRMGIPLSEVLENLLFAEVLNAEVLSNGPPRQQGRSRPTAGAEFLVPEFLLAGQYRCENGRCGG